MAHRTQFNAMMDLSSNGFASYSSYKYLIDNEILDVKNFIDYMFLIFLSVIRIGWQYWTAGRSRVNPKKGFRFFSWDARPVC